MSFNPSIPMVTDFLAISQKQILANYQSIFSSFAQNHSLLTAPNQGQHTSLTFRSQTVDPTTDPNQIALYNKIVSGVPQIFFRPSSNQTPIQMTNSNLNTSNGASESSFMAGPFTIYMGYRFNVTNNQTIILTPSSNLIYVGLTVFQTGANSANALAVAVTTNQFNVQYDSVFIPTLDAVYYLAIGST